VQFLLFDVSATLVFLVGYLAVASFLRRRTLAVVAMSVAPRPGGSRAPVSGRREAQESPKPVPTKQCCREWPRLSAPR